MQELLWKILDSNTNTLQIANQPEQQELLWKISDTNTLQINLMYLSDQKIANFLVITLKNSFVIKKEKKCTNSGIAEVS